MRKANLANNNKGERCTFNGVLFGIYFALLPLEFVSLFPGVSVGRLAAFALIIMALLQIRNWKIRWDIPLLSLWTFLTVCLISFFSLNNPGDQLNTYGTVFLNATIVIIAYSLSFSEVDASLWRRALILTAILLGFAAIISPGKVGDEWVSGRIVPNLFGSQQDPNEFCGYYLLPVSFFTYELVRNRKFAFCIPIVFCLYTVVMTGSRGGLLAVGFSAILAVLFAVKNNRHVVLISIVSITLLIIVVLSFDVILNMLPAAIRSRFLLTDSNMASADSRLAIWDQLLNSFVNSNLFQQLFGHGFGSTILYNTERLVAHNVYIELLFDVGALGLLTFLGVVVSACIRLMRNRDYVLLSSIAGELVLISSLSSFWSKTLWGLFILALVTVSKGRSHEH